MDPDPYRSMTPLPEKEKVLLFNDDREKVLWEKWTAEFLVVRLRKIANIQVSNQQLVQNAAERADVLILERRKRMDL